MADTGRPTDYSPEMCETAMKLRAENKTHAEIAAELGVHRGTYFRWLNEHREFRDAIKEGEEAQTDKVVRNLYERANGFKTTEMREEVIYDASGSPTGKRVVKTIKNIPPDTGAAVFVLKNRRPKEWQDRRVMDAGESAENITQGLSDLATKLGFKVNE